MSVGGVLKNATIFFVGPLVLFILLVLLIALVKSRLNGGKSRDPKLPDLQSDYQLRGDPHNYAGAPLHLLHVSMLTRCCFQPDRVPMPIDGPI